MKRAPKLPKVYSSTIDATKAAAFYDRLHMLRDALEAIQRDYADDIAAVFEEASEALNADPALLRMAFTEERQKRKREARIAKMDAGKAHQLDLLGDVAAGSDGLPSGGKLNPKLVEKIAQAIQTKAGTAALLSAVDTMIEQVDAETGEITEQHTPREGAATIVVRVEDRQDTAAPASQPSYDVIGEIPSFLLREQPPKPPPPPAA